jgi:ADP-ribosylglycohydrolase
MRRRIWSTGVVGQVTDDTEMAFALLLTLIDGYTKDKAVMEYMNWVNNINCKPECPGNAPFTGRNTRHLFETKKSKPTIKFYNTQFNQKYHSEEERQKSQSNGCLMRSYPLAFVNNETITETDTKITNPSDLAVEAVKVYVFAIRMAILGHSKEQIKAEVGQILTEPKLVEVYKKAVNNEFVNVTEGRAWIGYAFYCAFWVLFNFDNYKDAIDAVICLSSEEGKKAFICDKTLSKKSYARVHF